jgi:hypothetical protein
MSRRVDPVGCICMLKQFIPSGSFELASTRRDHPFARRDPPGDHTLGVALGSWPCNFLPCARAQSTRFLCEFKKPWLPVRGVLPFSLPFLICLQPKSETSFHSAQAQVLGAIRRRHQGGGMARLRRALQRARASPWAPGRLEPRVYRPTALRDRHSIRDRGSRRRTAGGTGHLSPTAKVREDQLRAVGPMH